MYTVRLPNFEGPLELLLYLVKREEVDIYDIPIARITEEFLAYVRLMQLLDLELAGEFLVMAATLMQIKARMLLPRPQKDEGGSDEDPRADLVRQLIEYSRYSDVADQLQQQHQEQRYVFYRRFLAEQPPPPQVEYRNATLFDLLTALAAVLQRQHTAEAAVQTFEREQYSVAEQMEAVLQQLRSAQRLRFGALVAGRSRAFIVATFLALLELCKNGAVALRQHDGEDDIVIEPLATEVVTLTASV